MNSHESLKITRNLIDVWVGSALPSENDECYHQLIHRLDLAGLPDAVKGNPERIFSTVLRRIEDGYRSDPPTRKLIDHLLGDRAGNAGSARPSDGALPCGMHVNISGFESQIAVGGQHNFVQNFQSRADGKAAEIGTQQRIILFLAAAPSRFEHLSFDREIKVIQRSLRESMNRELFRIEEELAVTLDDLQRCFLEHQPDIAHFSGHGSKGAIYLETRERWPAKVEGTALARLFGILDRPPRCVFLNACETFDQAQAISESVDSVIAVPGAIRDSAATAFASAFYQALMARTSVRRAFELGLHQLELDQHPTRPRLMARRCDPESVRF